MTSMLNVRTEAAAQDRLRAGKRTKSIQLIQEGIAGNPVFAAAEDRFRQIAARCLDQDGAGSQSLAITSTVNGEGKSTIALGLAFAAAQNLGTQVLLVETEMQQPQLAEDFNLEGSVGLSQYLYGEVEIEAILQPTRIPNVWLLPAGHPVNNPGPLIRSARFKALMETLYSAYPTVIVDVPPMLTSPHAAVITGQAESVVLVARAGRTHVDDARNAVRAVGQERVKGVVLNGTRVWLPRWITRIFGISPLTVD
jgi:capsular exopolysaccharide synthesis family protein